MSVNNENTKVPTLSEKLGIIEGGENKLIIKLALDIRTWNMDHEVGKKYMETFLKREISTSTYYRYLERLDSEDSLQAWLNEQAKIGFVKNQRDMIEEVLRLKTKINGILELELTKEDTVMQKIVHKDGASSEFIAPNPSKNKMYILGLMRQLTDLNKRLNELNLGNPIVANIKYMIDHAKQETERRVIPLRAIHESS